MISPMAQLLIMVGAKKPDEKVVVFEGYRPRCLLCDNLGKDAREPCIGHDMATE